MTAETMSKADFAVLCNVKPCRVSHWIKEGKISGAALAGKGARAHIVVDEAQRQLRIRLDPTQRTGNGLKTRLNRPAPAASEPTSRFPPAAWDALRGLPNVAAWDMVCAGASMRVVFTADESFRVNLKQDVEQAFGAPLPADFDPPDWQGLAEEADEPVDLPAWRAWRVEEHARRFGG